MNREKYYQRREKNQWEPYTTTINNNTELYKNYRQNLDLAAPYAWNKMRKFWSGLIQEIEQEYSGLKANGKGQA
ncbi:MAG: hypothetical protein KAJ14_15175 [Candidatus Omnitrophica bacterium]|nr:hypothetical protein [Candidatus Omnitrophota bacterium]